MRDDGLDVREGKLYRVAACAGEVDTIRDVYNRFDNMEMAFQDLDSPIEEDEIAASAPRCTHTRSFFLSARHSG